ncbi:Ceramide synthase 2 [Nosema granulosis]|uniref:Ceramide synthase 2 n=1 Tax=Nosema granulosis TaxID=83296 RepID=A0A9P6H3T6_9MICR|nr:Ceramide synthase 2 [Nosema granulosis]
MDTRSKTEVNIFISLVICWTISACLMLFNNIVVKRIADKLLKGRSAYTYKKASISIYKIFSYSFITFYGYLFLKNEAWVMDRFSYCVKCDFNSYSLKTSFYFIYEFSFYITELQNVLIHGYNMKDKNQMILHHIVTLTLIGGSFLLGYSRYGMVVMALHDISDPFLESAKLFIYLKEKITADIIFTLFSIIFIISRLFIFPYVVLYPLGCHLFSGKANLIEHFFFVFLSSLFVMHVFWTKMIGKVAKNVIVKHEVRDVRSSSTDLPDRTKID